MDHRCPVCAADLKTRKAFSSVLMQLEGLCPRCRSRIRVNLHRAETTAMYLSFAAVVGFGLAGYYLKSDAFVLAGIVAVMAGSVSLPLIDRALRTWPRYVLPEPGERPKP